MVVHVIEDAVRGQDEGVSMLHLAVGDAGILGQVFVLPATKHLSLESEDRGERGKLIRSIETMGLWEGIVLYSSEPEED